MTMLRSGGWILLVCLAAPATAQAPDHFGQLVGVIEPGDDVRVTLSGGRIDRARVVGVTLQTLSVRIRDRQLDLGRDDVWAVRYRVSDPIRDGFWRGFATGAVCGGVLLPLILCSVDICAASTPAGSGFVLTGGLFGMVGGWIGAGVDHMTQREEGWPTTTSRAWSVAPLATPDRRGVALSLSF